MNTSLLSGRNVLLFSLVAEGATALALVLAPGLVAQLIFGSAVEEAGVAYGRLLGVSLLALVIACWPGADAVSRPALHAVVVYNLLAAVYLGLLGGAQHYAGLLLWPAVVEHALVALLLATRVYGARPETVGR
ncbi:hypothetical protein ACIPRI_19905 [Variovorax sp. LARHSF232]